MIGQVVMHRAAPLIERLPQVRGRYRANAALAPLSWFRVGGPAEVLFRPADVEDLACFLASRPVDVPVTVIGASSNVLIRDGGVRGVVVRLGGAFGRLEVDGRRIRAGAAALDGTVARTACEAGLAGFEFLIGVPGTIGGALRMNAGAYGQDMQAIVADVQVLDATGRLRILSGADVGFGYRHTNLPQDWIFTETTLVGIPDSVEAISTRMEEIRRVREDSQPIRSRTGGSTFANPPGHKAWQLIDTAGCRGLRVGGAQVSEQHCNFLINTGTASATDLETLGEEVRRRVFEVHGIALQWEIRRIGVAASLANGAPTIVEEDEQ